MNDTASLNLLRRSLPKPDRTVPAISPKDYQKRIEELREQHMSSRQA